MALNLNELFFPHYTAQQQLYKKTGYPFAYYTNADTALKIIRSHSIWMRKPSMMNDYSEVEHGFICLNAVLNTEVGMEFREAIDMIHAGLSTQVDALYPNVMSTIRATTFIACFTKHNPLEDNYGRLSMWRAYGRNNGIAFIFKPELFFNNLNSTTVGVTNSPVAYLSPVEIAGYLKEITTNIKSNISELKAFSPESLRDWILLVYAMAIICNKHAGFKEEEEWRAITYAPLESILLEKTVQVISGTPQAIKSFHFVDKPESGLTGLNFKDLLKRIIIGPCEHPEATKEALALELRDNLGIVNPQDIIQISNIPLRPS
jgi:hypothetical protein